jgi:hypothetical protein
MNSIDSPAMAGQFIGLCMAAWVAAWVAYDCGRRGKDGGETFLWASGTFLAMIIVLPMYLWLRWKASNLDGAGGGSTHRDGAQREVDKPNLMNSMQSSLATQAKTPCRYCGHVNEGDPVYCVACSRQLKSSESIHRRP